MHIHGVLLLRQFYSKSLLRIILSIFVCIPIIYTFSKYSHYYKVLQKCVPHLTYNILNEITCILSALWNIIMKAPIWYGFMGVTLNFWRYSLVFRKILIYSRSVDPISNLPKTNRFSIESAIKLMKKKHICFSRHYYSVYESLEYCMYRRIKVYHWTFSIYNNM